MMSTRAILRQCQSTLMTAHEPPQRTALAFAIGVGLSFSPLLGLQIALAVLLCWSCRLNRLVLLVGLCTNLPWLMAPYYAATTGTAAWLMGIASPAALASEFAGVFAHSVFSAAFWAEVVSVLWPLFWPFVIGTSAAALIMAAAAYWLALAIATAARARLEHV
jgi:uncharacterized protein (DUF2062 family)